MCFLRWTRRHTPSPLSGNSGTNGPAPGKREIRSPGMSSNKRISINQGNRKIQSADIVIGLQQMTGKAMAEGVGRGPLGNPGLPDGGVGRGLSSLLEKLIGLTIWEYIAIAVSACSCCALVCFFSCNLRIKLGRLSLWLGGKEYFPQKSR